MKEKIMSKKKAIEVVVVSYEEYAQDTFVYPSKYCIRSWDGTFIFYKTSKRLLAQEAVDVEYGSGMYSVREV
jgi:hypothetical protein